MIIAEVCVLWTVNNNNKKKATHRFSKEGGGCDR